MKFRTNLLLLLFFPVFADAQHLPDSLRNVYVNAPDDITQYNIGKSLYDYYERIQHRFCLLLCTTVFTVARKNNEVLAEAYYMDNTAYQLIGLGKYAEALQYVLDVFQDR